MENTMVVPQKIKNRIIKWSGNFIAGYVLKRIESRDLNRCLYAHVNSSIIYNSQKVEATQASIEGWVDKQYMV